MNELDIIRNHFLGFHNDFFDGFRRVSTYPPYNVKEKDDLGVIEFAVAGFAEKDLKVEVKDQSFRLFRESCAAQYIFTHCRDCLFRGEPLTHAKRWQGIVKFCQYLTRGRYINVIGSIKDLYTIDPGAVQTRGLP